MTSKNNSAYSGFTIFVLATICCLLWGSAFPFVKIGYVLFDIAAKDSFSQILFGGVRFVLAGILAWMIGSVARKKPMVPEKWEWSRIVKLCSLQTVLQYLFFYMGLARTTGVKSSIIEASNVFVAIVVSSLIFRQEKLTIQKMLGCLVGFAGVVVINLSGNGGFDMHFSLMGEGFIFFSTFAYAFSSVLTKKYSKESDPVMLSAFQFVMGGLIMIAIGLLGGGHLDVIVGKGIIVLLYLAFISAVAFSLWGLMLKRNPISQVAVYGFMNPMFGVILSALLLSEKNESLSVVKAVVSLLLVTMGIIIVNRNNTEKTQL